MRTSILSRMLTEALILTAFVIVVLSTVSFVIARSVVENTIRAQLASVASIAEDALERTLQSHHERAALLSSSADIYAAVTGQGGTQTLDRLMRRLQEDEPSIRGMDVRDRNGRIRARVGDTIDLPSNISRRAVVDANGWIAYTVLSPVRSDNQTIGYLGIKYDSQPITTSLAAVASTIGETAAAVIVRQSGAVLAVQHVTSNPRDAYIVTLPSGSTDTWATVIQGTEEVSMQTDYRGHESLIVSRYLPALGWGLLFQVDRDEVLSDVRMLASVHAAVGTVLLVLAALLAWILARQLTQPLRSLTDRVRTIGPDHWTIARTVHTGDEVEVLERVAADMAHRLKDVYEHQEEIISDRTAALKRQYALDRTILETVDYGIVTTDRNGTVIGANAAALRLLGMRANAAIGQQIVHLFRLHGHKGDPLKGAHPVLKTIKSGRAERSSASAHYSVLRADEQLLPVAYSVAPLIEGKKIFGGILVFQDITEERKIDYMKSEFISLASHQLRTPLSAIRWYTELLSEEKKNLDSEQRGYLREMQHSVERMSHLLMSLLNASRMNSEDLHPDIKETDVRTVLRELHEDMESAAREAGVALTVSLPKKAVPLKTDAMLLRIVLQNLVGNAVKYTQHASKKSVSVDLVSARGMVKIRVADEGMGIPAAEQKRVFQKFFRAKNVRKVDTDGNGLGLYICKTIVERLGGTITFTSNENKGSVFTVTLKKTGAKKAA